MFILSEYYLNIHVPAIIEDTEVIGVTYFKAYIFLKSPQSCIYIQKVLVFIILRIIIKDYYRQMVKCVTTGDMSLSCVKSVVFLITKRSPMTEISFLTAQVLFTNQPAFISKNKFYSVTSMCIGIVYEKTALYLADMCSGCYCPHFLFIDSIVLFYYNMNGHISRSEEGIYTRHIST